LKIANPGDHHPDNLLRIESKGRSLDEVSGCKLAAISPCRMPP
jgi:hypothetical protein